MSGRRPPDPGYRRDHRTFRSRSTRMVRGDAGSARSGATRSTLRARLNGARVDLARYRIVRCRCATGVTAGGSVSRGFVRAAGTLRLRGGTRRRRSVVEMTVVFKILSPWNRATLSAVAPPS